MSATHQSKVYDLATGAQIDPLETAYRRVCAEVEKARLEQDRFGGSCDKCRYHRASGGVLRERWCVHPLVQSHAFSRKRGEIVAKPWLMETWMASVRPKGIPDLCGDERQLWQPKLSRWQRLIAWFLAPWKAA